MTKTAPQKTPEHPISDAELKEFRAVYNNNILGVIESRGISKAELGRMMGMTEDSFQKWQTGKTGPSWRNLLLLTKVLKLRLMDLLSGTKISNDQSSEEMTPMQKDLALNTAHKLIAKLEAELSAAQTKIHQLESSPPDGRKTE